MNLIVLYKIKSYDDSNLKILNYDIEGNKLYLLKTWYFNVFLK